MDREALIGAVAQVLGSHDCDANFTDSFVCICHRQLLGIEVGVSMRRHRAEKIIEHLERLEALKEASVQ
jgi:hypothetical protein